MQISRFFKRTAIVPISIIAVIALLLFGLNLSSRPPKESTVIRNFNVHRAAYERLRDMLLTDESITEVADWGVTTVASPVSVMPPAGGLSESRYHEYLALLGQIGARGAARGRENPEVRILVWASGFAGNTRHIAISWLDDEPTDIVGSLDRFYSTPKPRHPVYRHIDGNWYIWADW